MLKKTLLALAISAASMTVLAGDDSVNKLTLGTDLTSVTTESYSQTLIVSTDAASDVDQNQTLTLDIELDGDAFFMTSISTSDVIAPTGMKVIDASVVGGNTIEINYTIEQQFPADSEIKITLPAVDTDKAIVAADNFITVTITNTDADAGVANTGLVTTVADLSLVKLVVPFVATATQAAGDVVVDNTTDSFIGGNPTASVGNLKLVAATGLQNDDGTPRNIEPSDVFNVILDSNASAGYSSISIGDEVVSTGFSGTRTAFTFELTGISGDADFDVVYTAGSSTLVDMNAATSDITSVKAPNDAATYLSNSKQLSAISTTIPGKIQTDTVINSIPNSKNSDQTYIRVTNNSEDVALVSIDVTGIDGTNLGTGDLAAIGPRATVVYKAKDIETAIGTSWNKRANGVISATENITVVPLIRTSDVLTNQSGFISNQPPSCNTTVVDTGSSNAQNPTANGQISGVVVSEINGVCTTTITRASGK